MLVMPYFTCFGVLRMHYFTYFEHFQCLILHVLSIFNALKKGGTVSEPYHASYYTVL